MRHCLLVAQPLAANVMLNCNIAFRKGGCLAGYQSALVSNSRQADINPSSSSGGLHHLSFSNRYLVHFRTRNPKLATHKMFHIVLAIASRFLYFGSVLQGFSRKLRHLGVISSQLIPALSPPPPIALLDAPVPFVAVPEVIMPPYPPVDLIAIERIELHPPLFASPIPSYQSSLMTVSSSGLPKLLPLFIIMLAIISGFVVILPEIFFFFMNVSKSTNVSRFVRYFLPASLLLLWMTGPVRTYRMSLVIVLKIFLARRCVLLHFLLGHAHPSLPRPRFEHGTSIPM